MDADRARVLAFPGAVKKFEAGQKDNEGSRRQSDREEGRFVEVIITLAEKLTWDFLVF